MRLVFAGTPEPALPALRALIDSPRHEVVAVVTRPDAPAGRGRRLLRSPVGMLADEHGIEVLTPPKASDPDFLARLTDIAPDCAPVVAYGALLPKVARDIPTHGWVNLHFSLLPAWRGAAPVQASIRAGDEITGASTFRIVRELDAGPVFGVVTERVDRRDTAGDLLGRLAESGAALLAATLDGIEDGTVTAAEQPAADVSYAAKLTVEDARLDFTLPATAVDRTARALTPEPGPWAMFRGERLKLGPVLPVVIDEPLPPGRILVERKRVLVGTATDPVVLGEVQAQGKRRMAATDWARGVRMEQDEELG
ncbi:methionyl-tRNA formyltransferase [Actinoalloteichus hymeniacidonis]|uniref:Methionyl-tRNA formyltransferase n=1 Tax=Actinoalloteichus hymeniacidonis TaxID=340345 RepID=A0AAC9HPK5_9PSEU|nr:methionyl-tRNA formyltransferase [Actinoalloteichus hymeniacidonis]AOS63127.1 methionyl-tRNA formyltransferase [Actinoalloteichus hymeniacidonis]MBB5908837.1 methionyl-tRNA formyltransferase [Actinoalloteichus hymeniacidonis]